MNGFLRKACRCLGVVFATSVFADPIGVIVDTDIGSSTDDLFALSVVRSQESAGIAKLLGVMVDRPCAADDAIDRFVTFTAAMLHHEKYGWDRVPIGTVPKLPPGKKAPIVFVPYTKLSLPCELWEKPPLPAPVSREGIVTNAVTLYRLLLSSAGDRSVDICAIGFFTNLRGLMDSVADDVSSSSGMELIRKKVRTLRIMAGSFDGSFYHPEYNVWGDPESADRIFREWPGKIVVSPYENGSRVYLPARKVVKALPASGVGPIGLVYSHWDPDGTVPKSQLMWDPLTALGIRVDWSLFTYRGPGEVEVELSPESRRGYTTFRESGKGRVYIQELASDLLGPEIRDGLQKLVCGRVTPDLAERHLIRIGEVCGTNSVSGGFVVLRNASTNDFDLSRCHLTSGLLESPISVSYQFPTGTVLRAGTDLRLVGSERWPGSAIPDGTQNVLLWTEDWDILHEVLVNTGGSVRDAKRAFD